MKELGIFNNGRDVGIAYKASAGGGSSVAGGGWDGTIEYPPAYLGFRAWCSMARMLLVCILVTLPCMAAKFLQTKAP